MNKKIEEILYENNQIINFYISLKEILDYSEKVISNQKIRIINIDKYPSFSEYSIKYLPITLFDKNKEQHLLQGNNNVCEYKNFDNI